MNATGIEVAQAATRFQKERWEHELLELDARIETLKHDHRPVRREIDRLFKRKIELMRKLGML